MRPAVCRLVSSVMLGSCLVGGILLWCVAAQAQIVRYQGPDGRLYFTNLPCHRPQGLQ